MRGGGEGEEVVRERRWGGRGGGEGEEVESERRWGGRGGGEGEEVGRERRWGGRGGGEGEEVGRERRWGGRGGGKGICIFKMKSFPHIRLYTPLRLQQLSARFAAPGCSVARTLYWH